MNKKQEIDDRVGIIKLQFKPKIIVSDDDSLYEIVEMHDIKENLRKKIIDNLSKDKIGTVKHIFYGFKIVNYIYDKNLNILYINVTITKAITKLALDFNDVTHKKGMASIKTSKDKIYGSIMSYITNYFGESAADTWMCGDIQIINSDGETNKRYELDLELLNICFDLEYYDKEKKSKTKSSKKSKQSTDKTRKAPTDSATKFKEGKIKTGNDGKKWIVKTFNTKHGSVNKWIKYS